MENKTIQCAAEKLYTLVIGTDATPWGDLATVEQLRYSNAAAGFTEWLNEASFGPVPIDPGFGPVPIDPGVAPTE